MKLNQAFVCLGLVWCILLLNPASAIAADDFSAEQLHSLYKSGKYFECYRASAEAAKTSTRSALPHFYAALALSKTEDDSRMKEKVRNPYGKALHYLETAKTKDPQGRQLQGVRKGLALAQRELVGKAVDAYHQGNSNIRTYFDRMTVVFNTREGTWKNYFHHGRYLADELYDFREWDNPYYRLADTGRNIPGLSDEVRRVIYLHNLCRMNPQLFRDTYLRQFLNGEQNHDHYVTSLLDDLSKAQPRKPLYPDAQLLQAADFHAKDLAQHRIFQHASSDGTSFSQRLRQHAKDRSYCGENCAAGYNAALTCFMGLLIDRGVESLGHRKNILSEGFKYIGVGVIDPEDQWKIWVFDFAGN